MSRTPAVSPDAELAARLTRDAQRNPRMYRWWLAAIALFGDVALTVAQVLPLAAPILIGMFFVNLPFFYWLGAAAILFLAWLLRPQFRMVGCVISPQQAPLLFDELKRLREKLDVPGEMEVRIDDDFNASAAETPGLFGLLGKRRVLTLGMPLLATLTREELLAVIAHELGHFSRWHGRFGHWLYRARVGWLEYARQLDSSTSPLEAAAAWYARHFVPYFSVRSFVYSRMCEYEADRDAASAVGGAAMAHSLTRIAVLARVWHEGVPREMTRLQLESPEPPSGLYEKFAAAARAWPLERQEQWLREELATPAGWLNTHPSLSERLASIGEAASLHDGSQVAGPSLFGDAWPLLLAEFNKKWLARIQSEWLMQHLRLKHIAQPLLHADPASASMWDAEKRLARARALRWIEPHEGLTELGALHGAFSSNPRITFAYAAALLNENDEGGVVHMEELAKTHPEFRSPAYARLADYFHRRGHPDRSEHWLERLRQSAVRRARATAAFFAEAEQGNALPTSLGNEERTVLKEALERDMRITQALLMRATVPLATAESETAARLTVHGLVLALDTAEVQRSGISEEELSQHYDWALGSLIPADQHAAVRTYFTTEPMPEFDVARYALVRSREPEQSTPPDETGTIVRTSRSL
jgi:Zn-dependent protease with chaperone function